MDRQDLQAMHDRLLKALRNHRIIKLVRKDFCHTFVALGLSEQRANDLSSQIFLALNRETIEVAEAEIRAMIAAAPTDEGTSLVDVLHRKLAGRASLIHSQVRPFLLGEKGKTAIDFGCGDGQVTQLLHDDTALCLNICGVDVRHYPFPGVSVPISQFNGKATDFGDSSFTVGVMTNVAHHEANNEIVLAEVSRIVARKLVVIETVPVGVTPEEIELDRERTFSSDWLYNRTFHNADVPVPGTYETPDGWIARFKAHGWACTHSEDLGYDQPTIRDVHHLLVFER